LQEFGAQPNAAIQVSSYIYSPAGMSGVETISFELAEQFDKPVDHVFCQSGGGGLCLAIARGYRKFVEAGKLKTSPAIHCVQPEGNDTIAGPFRSGATEAQEVHCTTNISGLQVANVNDGHLVIEECRPTGGTGHLVTDDFVWETQKRLSQEEGIFCEPAAAVALAGALQAAANGEIDPDATTVCLITGTGFKDEVSVERMYGGKSCRLLDLTELRGYLEG